MTPDVLRRSVEAAILPMCAAFGPTGIEGGRFLADHPGGPVLRLRTGTEIERVALQSQVWMLPQVHILLLRLGLSANEIARIRLDFDSAEAPVP